MPKPAVTLDLSDLTSPRIHRLHGYWQHQRDKRRGLLPRRGDSGAVGRCEFARLPLSEDGAVVTQILAMEDYDFPQLDAVPSGGATTG